MGRGIQSVPHKASANGVVVTSMCSTQILFDQHEKSFDISVESYWNFSVIQVHAMAKFISKFYISGYSRIHADTFADTSDPFIIR